MADCIVHVIPTHAPADAPQLHSLQLHCEAVHEMFCLLDMHMCLQYCC